MVGADAPGAGQRGRVHRHTGEVHAFTLTGARQILGTETVLRAGDYLHEPTGNVTYLDFCATHQVTPDPALAPAAPLTGTQG